ncbi:MAG TPA: metalloregulator ArsR/SmtB family transcription factor [Acidimicrobiales bacterium]
MPTLDATETALPVSALPVTVRTSLVTDLVWAMWVHPSEPEPDYPARFGRFAPDSELPTRLAAFWDDGERFFTEVLVVADRAGALFEEDPESLFERLQAAAAGPSRPEPLSSEVPDDQKRFRARLKRLHDSARLRRSWISLIRAVWDEVGPDWESRGRIAAESVARELRHKFGQEIGITDVQSLIQCDLVDTFQAFLRDAASDGARVLLVPGWYNRKCLYLRLPGSVLVTPARQVLSPGPSEETRLRARRFKGLGDPTRLAILEALGRRPRAIGELANLFGVAQPTVSNHVRVLREAGLVVEGKGAGRRLEANVVALDDLFRESLGVVAGEPSSVRAGIT